MQDIESEDRIRGEEDARSLQNCWERTILKCFVCHIVEQDISIPLPRNLAIFFYYIIVLHPIKALTVFARHQLLGEGVCYSEDTARQVRVLQFCAVLIEFLLLFAGGDLAVHLISFLKGESFSSQAEYSLPERYALHLDIKEFYRILGFSLRDFYREVRGDFGVC